MKLRHEPLELHTLFTFRIAHGAKRAHVNTLVSVEQDGIVGLGEAAPSHYYGETTELVQVALDTWAPHLGDDPFALDALEARLDQVLQGNTAARAGIEMAVHDWIGKKLGLPVWKLFGVDPSRTPLSCCTLGMADPEEMERKLDTLIDFPMLKVKLGGPGDVDNLRRIRARYKGKLQVDANTAWNAADAVRVLRKIEPLDIELVEQPVPVRELDDRTVHDMLGWQPVELQLQEDILLPDSPCQTIIRAADPPDHPASPASEPRSGDARRAGPPRSG